MRKIPKIKHLPPNCLNQNDNVEMIQPLVEELLLHLLCFRFWLPGGQAKNQIGPKFGPLGQVT
jgi:hypothetical protein